MVVRWRCYALTLISVATIISQTARRCCHRMVIRKIAASAELIQYLAASQVLTLVDRIKCYTKPTAKISITQKRFIQHIVRELNISEKIITKTIHNNTIVSLHPQFIYIDNIQIIFLSFSFSPSRFLFSAPLSRLSVWPVCGQQCRYFNFVFANSLLKRTASITP